jgi:catechol 2,3-dioxygenase-like lactoylglutathione lyase family enzyme
MKVGGVHHAAVSVRDLDRALDFYCEGLGLRKTLTMPIRGPEVTEQLRLKAGMTGRAAYVQGPVKVGQLELIEWRDGPERDTGPKRPGDPGVFLLSFETTREEIGGVYAHLQRRGDPIYSPLQTATVVNYGEIQVFVVEDPDGMLVEIVALPTKEEIAAFRAKGLSP